MSAHHAAGLVRTEHNLGLARTSSILGPTFAAAVSRRGDA
jgi:hypothetical protein